MRTQRPAPMRSLKSGMTLTLAALLALGTILSSCGDKTLDDYREKRANEERARLQAVEGTYRGTVKNSNGDTLGSLEMRVRADVVSQSSSDNLSTEFKAVINGSVTYSNGGGRTPVQISGGAYSRDNLLQVELKLPDAGGSLRTVTLHGNVQDGRYEGQIYESSAEEFGGNFILLKDGPVSTSQNLINTGRIAEIGRKSLTFIGTFQDDACLNPVASSGESANECPFQMTMLYQEPTPDQKFLKIFYPRHRVSVTVMLDGDIPVTFNDMDWDERTNEIKSTGSQSLYCTRTAAGGMTLSWDCTFTGENGHQVSAKLEPVPAGWNGGGKKGGFSL